MHNENRFEMSFALAVITYVLWHAA